MAYLFTEILIIIIGTQRCKRGFVKKTKARKLKIQEKHVTFTSLLFFSLEFNLERELCNISV